MLKVCQQTGREYWGVEVRPYPKDPFVPTGAERNLMVFNEAKVIKNLTGKWPEPDTWAELAFKYGRTFRAIANAKFPEELPRDVRAAMLNRVNELTALKNKAMGYYS